MTGISQLGEQFSIVSCDQEQKLLCSGFCTHLWAKISRSLVGVRLCFATLHTLCKCCLGRLFYSKPYQVTH